MYNDIRNIYISKTGGKTVIKDPNNLGQLTGRLHLDLGLSFSLRLRLSLGCRGIHNCSILLLHCGYS